MQSEVRLSPHWQKSLVAVELLSARTANRHWWAGISPKVIEITLVKELGNLAP
jgi:hypothetical protein